MERRRKRRGCSVIVLLLLFGAACLFAAVYFSVYHKTALFSNEGERILVDNQPVPFQAVSVEEGSLEEKYYYNLLGEEDQTAYQEILQGLRELSEEIYIHCSVEEKINMLLQYVLKDFPDIFWCEGGANSTLYSSNGSQSDGYTVMRPVYTYMGEVKEQKQAEIDVQVEECLSNIPAGASDYDKILYVYEYIVNTVDYELDSEDNQNIYSVFVNRKSVCAGYSKAAQYLLERLGVFCTYVTGTVQNQTSHAWNLVQCDGVYYYLDATWGDPVYQKLEGEEVPEWENISYDYMCCSEEELFRTHQLDGDFSFPKCDSMEANYYVVNGMYYDNYDSQTALKTMNDVIGKKGNPSVFKFSSSELYLKAREDIFNNLIHRAAQNLAEIYGLAQVQYFYQDAPELNKLTIYWQYE